MEFKTLEIWIEKNKDKKQGITLLDARAKALLLLAKEMEEQGFNPLKILFDFYNEQVKLKKKKMIRSKNKKGGQYG